MEDDTIEMFTTMGTEYPAAGIDSGLMQTSTLVSPSVKLKKESTNSILITRGQGRQQEVDIILGKLCIVCVCVV